MYGSNALQAGQPNENTSVTTTLSGWPVGCGFGMAM